MTALKKINLITGWTLFLLSTILYWRTMAPTVSLWDCGEFIACMAKMEVGHPPGAPFYLLLGRLFNLFAIDASYIAYTANLLSVFASAATVMFLYFSAEHILRRIFEQYTTSLKSYLIIVIAGSIGALAFAVSDTFWFSAVEAEVYALSVFFTALCFWLFLKWEDAYRQNGSGIKWIILIAYLTGLSVGVHLLNLLIIPVLILIVLLRKQTFTWKLLAQALLIGGGILGLLLFGVIQNGLWLAGKLEIMLVNGMGLPFNSGLLLFTLIIFGGLFFIVFKTRTKNDWQHLTAVVSLVFLIGYSSYAMIIIRADANTPINLNAPSDVFSLDSFLNREQYAQNPLIYGQYYNTQTGDLLYKDSYRRTDKQYEEYKKTDKYDYDDAGSGFFPRMHSSNSTHKYGYQQWAGANPNSTEKPSFVTNLRFFFIYQVNHMYIRYFMWNFSGRQNDEQGHGEMHKGNWITGIPFLDKRTEGSQLHSLSVNNPSRNTYFMLPLIIGLIGMFFLYRSGHKGKKYLAVISLLFLMTGPVIILYLNQTPFEPRERDYAFVGSFYAFALFIALGAFAIAHFIYEKSKSYLSTALGLTLITVAVPALMLSQNYNDHNRRGRDFALMQARSYLNSCDQNAILFTYGDNDTYPLWYVQEVEGFRTDIRVINYGLMGADWCVQQLEYAVNKTKGLDLSISQERYKTGDLDYALLLEQSDEYAPLQSVVQFIGSNKETSKLPMQNGMKVDFSPVNRFTLPYNDSDTLKWQCSKRVLYKNDIALLDILATNNWERPIYFTIGADPEIFLGLQKHLRYDGLVYKLMPYAQDQSSPIFMETDALYDIFMNKIDLGNGSDSYYDHYCRRTFDVIKYRQMSNLLAADLLENERQKDARSVIEKSLKELPIETAPDVSGNLPLIHLAYECGMEDEANHLANILLQRHLNNLLWYASLNRKEQQMTSSTFQQEIEKGQLVKMVLETINNPAMNDQLAFVYNKIGLEL
ncbi:glycosyltransferase family 117 protein [Carboxylicivirga sp. RSCT41]|uniref:glycosyltransferase family 117 protein n=1 Tax=Carboxylicivirga agarovorans TaxID=3417570 RepID=UPI003D349186